MAGTDADAILERIQDDLLASPDRGKLVPGLGGIRKARGGNPSRGKGKRGGLRHLYLFLEHRQHIHLLFLLDKDEQEDLSQKERDSIRQLVLQIKSD